MKPIFFNAPGSEMIRRRRGRLASTFPALSQGVGGVQDASSGKLFSIPSFLPKS
jgi:hypothetical protein